nr:DNRLRE domain-containing protein [Lachnospiraceae bacterium]
MIKRSFFLRQIIAGILAVVLALESPVSVFADGNSLDTNEYTVEIVEADETEEQEEDISESGLLDESLGECEDSDDLSLEDYNDTKPDATGNELPEGTAFLEDVSDNSISENEIQNGLEALVYEEDIYSEAPLYIDDNKDAEAEGNRGFHELTELRNENVRVYERPDHSITAYYYANPVNFWNADGKWSTIDNRLHYETGTYTNNLAPFDIRFKETADEEGMLSVSEEGMSVSFAYIPSVKDEACVVKESASSDIADEEKWSRMIRLVSDEDADDPGEDAQINELPDDEAREVSGNDEDDRTAYDKDALPILPVPQTVYYDSVEEGVSLKYEPKGYGVKETIILENPAVPDVYTFRVTLKGFKASLEGDEVIIRDEAGKERYMLPAPEVIDSEGKDDCEAGYIIDTIDDNTIELRVWIDGEWLKRDDRAFPVMIDPTIKKYRLFKSYEGLGDFVSVCSDGTKDTAKLKTGRKSSGKDGANIYRTYIKPYLPKIAAGSVVTDAKLRFSAGESNKLLYLLRVTKEWNPDDIDWNNQPLGNKAGKYGLKELTDFGKNDTITLDITKDVKPVISGMESYNGWCIVSQDEKAGVCRDIEPRRGKETPFLEITYKDFTGLEDYFSTHSQGAGSAGTGYINDFTGRLTFTHTDAQSAGERMPLSICHIYDIAYGERAGEEKWQCGFGNSSAYGEHFRLSTDVRLLIPADEADVDKFPYVYIDADGTKHYFKKANVTYYVNGAGKNAIKTNKEYPSAKDEDGLGLFVVPVTDGNLKGTYPVKIVNKSGSFSMYFDKDGYLGKITDSNRREDGKNGLDSTSKDKKQENAITYIYEEVPDSVTRPYDEKVRINEIISEIKGIRTDAEDQDEVIRETAVCIGRLEAFETESVNISVSYKKALNVQKAIDHLEKITGGDRKGNRKKDINSAITKLEEVMEDSFDTRVKRCTKVTDAAGISTVLEYDANGRLKSMRDPYEGGRLITYEYDDSNRLVKIIHPNGTYAVLAYDGEGHLISASDELGNRIEYDYGDKETKQTDSVIRITEYIYGTKGQSVLINHDDLNTAVYTYSGNDEKIGSKDDIENIYCFDDEGRTVSAYSRKKDGTVLGGALRKYTDGSDPEDAANKIKEQAFTGSQVTNFLTDGSFEKDKGKNGTESWEIFNTCDNIASCHVVKKTTDQKYIGMRSGYVKLAAKGEHNGEAGFKQTIKAPVKGNYTASVYIRTKGLDETARAKLYLSTKRSSSGSSEDKDSEEEGTEDSGEGDEGADDEGNGEEGSETSESGSVDYDTLPDINNGWKRIEATVKASKGEEITITLSLEGKMGEVWFDCAQIEKGTIADQYNLIPNGSFEGDFKVNPSLYVLPSGWAYGAELEKDGEEQTEDENDFPEDEDRESTCDADTSCVRLVTEKELGRKYVIPDGSRAVMIKGSPIKRRSIIINPNFGTDKASYTFSCYVKADCAPVPKKDSRRRCGIYIRGNNAGYNEDEATGRYKALSGDTSSKTLINTSVEGWQYVSVSLPVRNWRGRLIEIRFDYEIGTLCIDGCMLTKNEVQVKTYTSGGKLKTEQYGERVTTYDTDGRDRRKKEKLAGGASATYSYDNITNDVKEEKKSFRQPGRENANTLTAKYTYDEYGNVIK